MRSTAIEIPFFKDIGPDGQVHIWSYMLQDLMQKGDEVDTWLGLIISGFDDVMEMNGLMKNKTDITFRPDSIFYLSILVVIITDLSAE